jgi:hypothetical protein
LAVSEVRAFIVEAEEEGAVAQATEVVVGTILEEMVSLNSRQSSANLQITDEEPHLRLQPSLTSTKEQMISPILVVPVLLPVNVQPDLSHLQRVPPEPLSLSKSQRRSISSTLGMMSLRLSLL